MALSSSADIDVARLERSDSLPDHSYEASVPSSASTSQASIFSDNASEKSSVASSTVDDFRLHTDDRSDVYCASSQVAVSINHQQPFQKPSFQTYPTWADVTSVPLAQRQHPRRSSLARSQKPPPLVRQADRKLNFVDNLVESATQMVEVIWPMSAAYCKAGSNVGRGVLPLRTYIEETLRRSRTSYSTLQVALYYLVLIKAFVPQLEQMKLEPAAHCQTVRALMCGRRMFLAALILASKYLQDRNYSAKAWSRMSGLRVAEINANERVFLDKINWKLHVAKPVFDQWTEIVLKYTPSNQPPSPHGDGMAARLTWKALIPQLQPDLSGVPIPAHSTQDVATAVPIPFLSPITPTPVTAQHVDRHSPSVSEDITPTPSTITPPRFLEPKPTLLPPTPGLVRMGPLPTPQMTPSSVAASTPAASACNSRRPSICSAMAIAQRFGMNRCVNDEFPFPSMDKLRMASRRQSVASLASTRSSPESIITDLSYSSRASSTSSATTMSTTSACPAPRRSNLARLATTRNCRMAMSVAGEGDKEAVEGSALRPIAITEESDEAEPDFTVNERKLHTPHRHSKHAPHTHHITAQHFGTEKCRKRHRQSRGSKRSDLYDEVRYQLEDEHDDAMVIDSTESDEDMTSPSPASAHATCMLRRESNQKLQARGSQPPATLTMSPCERVPLSRHDGSKRACYSHVTSNGNGNNNTLGAFMNASLYMEIA